ncbi:RNA-binding domain-containing protein [Hymenobacter bucti]|uniref:RNA-binding domain-containing protein n=1 Tax=Hymenobacter bucti TaxID=1844114 RepID=A0ABW4QSF4_9BACT
MALPVNLKQLLTGEVVEWERLEFKEGWNPEAAVHTICAFANDLNNWGGGYFIVGVAEEQGKPVLPPTGLQPEQVDAIQKKLLELCYQITPTYIPVAEPEEYDGKLVLVVWAPGGDNRPYKAPVSLGRDNKEKDYYIRHFSSTTRAKELDRQRLLDLTAKVPFDDRINPRAELTDLDLGLIREHLQEINSKLADEATTMPFEELCRQMRIASGPPEYFKPLNIGLLMFNRQPERFFAGAIIEIIIHSGNGGRNFTEKRFTGPLPQQLRQALSFLQAQVLVEQVEKIPDQAEAGRFINYPFAALEEALANAVYHRSYELANTIEVNVRPTQIEILSFPGALPPVTPEQLRSGSRIVARDYRNRRVGDFLKELHLTEGRASGLPYIRTAMESNGSPPPLFEMDADRLSFLTTLRINPYFNSQSIAQREAQALREARRHPPLRPH